MAEQYKKNTNNNISRSSDSNTKNAGRSAHNRRRRTRGRSRRRKKFPAFAVLFLVVLLAAAAVLYAEQGIQYREIFYPNTVINGMDVSRRNVEQVNRAIDSEVKQYTLSIEKRDGTEEIHGSEIGLCAEYDGTLEQILKKQNPLAWGIHCFKKTEYEIKTLVSFDKEKLTETVNSLACMDPGQVEKPADAYLTYARGNGFQIVPEVQGNELFPELFQEEVSEAVRNLKGRMSLEELGIYKAPEVLADDPALIARREALALYADIAITYRFGSQKEILDGSTICEWLSVDGNGNVIPDENRVAEYVKGLADKYNTAYHAKKFKTSYGPTVTIASGHYGWLINQEAETEALIELIRSRQSQEREPVYSQKAESHDGPDYGNTYAELNLTAQHMYFYKNGKLLIETDFVSGNEAKGWSTPAGAFPLTYKQKNAVLKGKNYATPVTYWMPFNGNIGMHDGYWRSSFGGTIYKKNGSHGCVNLPPAAAKIVFANIEAGMPVLCYHLEGTEKKMTSTTGGSKTEKKQNSVGGKTDTTAVETQPSKTPESSEAESVGAEVIQPGEPGTAPSAAAQPGGPGASESSAVQPAGPGASESSAVQSAGPGMESAG